MWGLTMAHLPDVQWARECRVCCIWTVGEYERVAFRCLTHIPPTFSLENALKKGESSCMVFKFISD